MEICTILLLLSAFSYSCSVFLLSFAMMVIFSYIKKLLTRASDENESISVPCFIVTSIDLYTAAKASTSYEPWLINRSKQLFMLLKYTQIGSRKEDSSGC